MAEPQENTVYQDICEVLTPLKSRRSFSPGEVLFELGQLARGIYILESGKVKLLLGSPRVAAKTFEEAGPGTVLGLSESLTGVPCKLSGVAISEAQVGFVERQALLEFLRQHHAFCMEIVRLLSNDLHSLYFRCRALTSAEGRAHGKAVIH